MGAVCGAVWRLATGRLRWLAEGPTGGAPTECARGAGGRKPLCGGGASVVGETCERGRLDRRKLVRPRILGCVVVSDSITGRSRRRSRRRRRRTAAIQPDLTNPLRRGNRGEERNKFKGVSGAVKPVCPEILRWNPVTLY